VTHMVAKPIRFLGIVDHYQHGPQPFPYGPVDMFQLSQHKAHIVYPGQLSGTTWLLLVSTEFLNNADLAKWKLRVVHENGEEIGNTVVSARSDESGEGANPQSVSGTQEKFPLLLPHEAEFILFPMRLESVVSAPGRCIVESIYDGQTEVVGSAYFHYRPTPSFTLDQIKAIEANLGTARVVRMDISCKKCPSSIKTYTALKRSPKFEKDGAIWYADLPDDFRCSCGAVNYSLARLRESGHGMLLRDFDLVSSGLSYARQYSHQQVKGVSDAFIALLDSTSLEAPVQAFIEKSPILLARLNARRLFIKPTFLGKHIGDFAVIDIHNQLWLVEIERPTLPLFRKSDGHPTAKLMHAYEQVTDWMHQYQLHSAAVIDTLGLKREDVVAVRGLVVAGRSATVSHKILTRHLHNPPYPNVEFMTMDDLASGMVNLSRKLV
jgi:hypothetical protein